MSTESAMSAHL